MDSHIKKWLSYIKNSNKKRKLDDINENELIKELKYYSIETIIKIVKYYYKKILKHYIYSANSIFAI